MSEFGEVPFDVRHVDGLWIEAVTPPLDHVGMVLMFRVRNGGEIILIPPRSADIFRRTAAFGVCEVGILEL